MKGLLRRKLESDPIRAQSYARHRLHHGRAFALYHALKDRDGAKLLHPDRHRTVVFGSESALKRRPSPTQAAKMLADHDVISFDVFDTLLFRCVDDPTTLFHIVGAQLNVLDFPALRIAAEREARRGVPHGEVNLEQIYAQLALWGIDAQRGMRLEWELECACCHANAYLLDIVRMLAAQGKRLIAVSDMYLSAKQVAHLLEKSGYPPFAQVFVSCEHGANKASSELFAIVRRQCGEAHSYVHIGDHPHSDHLSPRRHGFSVLRYANVHTLGDPHRAHDLSVVTGSIYRGLVNAKLHGSDARFSMAFELGYVYGSLLAIGYCQYLQEQRRRLGLDQLLFLARDGDILRQVYALLYPQERADLIYVPWSRSAGIQLLAEAWKPDYFRRFLTHKCNQGLTLTQVFSAMGLEGLLPLLNQERSLDPGSELTAHEETQVRSFLLDHFDQILQCYERRRAGARHLLEPWLSSPGRVGVVDIGWTGSAAIALRALGEQWGWQKEIIGFLVGSDALRDHLQGGRTCGAHALGILHSYVFSSAQNRALWKQHDPTSGHNVLAELLFASPAPSLKCFSQTAEGATQLCWKPKEKHSERYAQIQQGIFSFTKDYLRLVPEVLRQRRIQGDDAYAPLCLLMDACNRPYLEEVLSWMKDNHV